MTTSQCRELKTSSDLSACVQAWRQEGLTVGLVPTMGALHHGHEALIRQGLAYVDRMIVSIFVNPKQFSETEDFSRYPRGLEADYDSVARSGAHVLYTPTREAFYPSEFSTHVSISGPASVDLEDRFRPHFFNGVATVLTKLFLQSAPHFAFFGEKDYQQLQVVRRLVDDLSFPIKIVEIETQRDPDGVAASSRNRYLSQEQRALAPLLFRSLNETAHELLSNRSIDSVLTQKKKELEALGFRIDYLELRDPVSLEPIKSLVRPGRLFIAAWIGTTRLIDTILVPALPASLM